MSHPPLRTAVLGAGFFGTTLALAARGSEAFDVVAISDLDAEAAAGLAARVGGISVAHSSVAFQHRVRNGQPDGGRTAEGTGPSRLIGWISSRMLGVAENRARV